MFELTRQCNYGSKCFFAHGVIELKPRKRNINYKRKQCHQYQKGYCPYGIRCQFKHILVNRLRIFKLITNN